MAIRQPLILTPLDLGTIISGNATGGHTASNLNRHNAIGLTWRSTGNANVWARGQFSANQSVDFAAIISANALVGTQYRLRLGATQADVDGAAPYDSGALTFINPTITRTDGLYHSHLELPSVQTAGWWRIDITGHTGDFEAADLVLGAKFTPGRFYNYDFQYGVRDLGDIAISPNGVLDETPGVIFRTIDFTLAWITEAEWETRLRPLAEKIGRRGIVYCCFDPQPTAYRQARTYMGVMDKALFARGVRKVLTFSQDYSIVSLI